MREKEMKPKLLTSVDQQTQFRRTSLLCIEINAIDFQRIAIIHDAILHQSKLTA